MDKIYTYQDLKNIQTFVYSLKRQAKSLGVELIIDSKNKYVLMDDEDEDVEASGYFDANSKKHGGKLGIGTNKPINRWLPVLIHESCHMDQWNEGLDLWKKSESMKYSIFGDWLKGKRCNVKEAHKCIDILKDLEIDCEKRSVEKMKKYNLPVDLDEYIRKANCYIFFYNRLKITRTWVEGDLYKPDLVAACNNTWYESYDTTPKKIESMFIKHGF